MDNLLKFIAKTVIVSIAVAVIIKNTDIEITHRVKTGKNNDSISLELQHSGTRIKPGIALTLDPKYGTVHRIEHSGGIR